MQAMCGIPTQLGKGLLRTPLHPQAEGAFVLPSDTQDQRVRPLDGRPRVGLWEDADEEARDGGYMG